MNITDIGYTLWFNDFVIDGEDIIFSSGSFNGLFRADLRTGRSDFLGFFPGEDMLGVHLYCGTYKYKNNILFIPAWGRQFSVYDKSNKSFVSIRDGVYSKTDNLFWYKYYGSIQVEKYVYVFGGMVPEILRIDMEKLEIKYYDGWLEELYSLGRLERRPFFYKDVCLVDNSIFVVSGQNNSILELNIERDSILIHPIGERGEIYDTIAYDGGYFWLTQQAKRIIKVNKANWNIQHEDLVNKNLANCFLSSVVLHGEVFLFPDKLGNTIKFLCKDCLTRDIPVLYGKPDKWYPNDNAQNIYFVKKITEDKLVFLCAQDCQLHIWDQKGEQCRKKFQWENAAMDYYNGLYSISNTMTIAELLHQKVPSYNLENFIYFVKRGRAKKNNLEKTFNNGNAIHAYIRDLEI